MLPQLCRHVDRLEPYDRITPGRWRTVRTPGRNLDGNRGAGRWLNGIQDTGFQDDGILGNGILGNGFQGTLLLAVARQESSAFPAVSGDPIPIWAL